MVPELHHRRIVTRGAGRDFPGRSRKDPETQGNPLPRARIGCTPFAALACPRAARRRGGRRRDGPPLEAAGEQAPGEQRAAVQVHVGEGDGEVDPGDHVASAEDAPGPPDPEDGERCGAGSRSTSGCQAARRDAAQVFMRARASEIRGEPESVIAVAQARRDRRAGGAAADLDLVAPGAAAGGAPGAALRSRGGRPPGRPRSSARRTSPSTTRGRSRRARGSPGDGATDRHRPAPGPPASAGRSRAATRADRPPRDRATSRPALAACSHSASVGSRTAEPSRSPSPGAEGAGVLPGGADRRHARVGEGRLVPERRRRVAGRVEEALVLLPRHLASAPAGTARTRTSWRGFSLSRGPPPIQKRPSGTSIHSMAA